MMKIDFILIVVLMVHGGLVMGDDSYPEQDQYQPYQQSPECRNFDRVQTHVDISLLTGWWYGEELIDHKNNTNNPFTSCLKIHISNRETAVIPNYKNHYGVNTSNEQNYDLAGGRQLEDTSRNSIKYLRITWTQESGPIIYNVKYSDTEENHGIWIPYQKTSSPVNDKVISPLDRDASPEPPLYTEDDVQEPTTILVIKAVGTHLTLTFCQSSGFIKTVTVSRKPNTLKADDIESIHRILKSRNLTTEPSTRLCQLGYTISAAISTKVPTTLAIFLLALLLSN